MSTYKIFAWNPLLRPPLPDQQSPEVPESPLKALSCRNQLVSVMALVTGDEPARNARLEFSDLSSADAVISSDNISLRLVGVVPTPEAGRVCDPLYEVDEFDIDRSATLWAGIGVDADASPGIYTGSVSLLIDGEKVAENEVELEVAAVTLPDVHDWSFFLNVWMNPATIARWHGVQVWSEEHFDLLWPYVQDLALHGQKSVVAPICYQPWGTQTRDPYPSTISWIKRGDDYEFDFSVFDRYVELHEQYGIDRAIHCYSIVQGPGATDSSVIDYMDSESGERVLLRTKVGEDEWIRAWKTFLGAFREHLHAKGWFDKVYIAFDEKTDDVMDKLCGFLQEYASDFKTSLAGNTSDELAVRLDDLSLQIGFNERGVAETAPPERSAMGVAELLSPDNVCVVTRRCPDKMLTTFYVCCGPAYPNTFLFSPLVESRMLPFLAVQGGFDGFLRWSYNDWSDDPYQHPEWNGWPTGDTFFVYPGKRGPVSSLRWEQLREGIYDYELAIIASGNIIDAEEMVDFEQAVALACRNPNGKDKSVGDIEIARRLLIPLARRQGE